MKRIKVISSDTGLARWYNELDIKPLGEIPRQDIPSPYFYSPTHEVYAWKGKRVINVETAHTRFEIFDVGDMQLI